MMMKRLLVLISIYILVAIQLQAQTPPVERSDANLRRVGFHTGNRIGISFYNDGQIAGFNTGVDIRGEWPLGSGYNYIGDLIPLIGIEFTNTQGQTRHSVTISRGPRTGQGDEKSTVDGHFWGFNPRPGYLNPLSTTPAMSHLPNSWPIGGWIDQPEWYDTVNGIRKTVWNGYFGKGRINADQESYFVADDQADDQFNSNYRPDSNDASRLGMGLVMKVRGFQWSSFLAEDCLFWLYDITNEGTTLYKKAVFGTVVGTLAGGDGDSGDDLGYFDPNNNITYSWDSDNKGNKGQKVGYVGYAFLESPGNPYDGIDNDGDSQDPNSPRFVLSDFDSVRYNIGSTVVLIDPGTYERTLHTISAAVETVSSLGARYIIRAGVTVFHEGFIKSIQNGISIPDTTAYDGYDNDLDGLIDENQAIDYETRIRHQPNALPPLKYKNYITGAGLDDPLLDEKRDNDAGTPISSYIRRADGSIIDTLHWSGDEDGDWEDWNEEDFKHNDLKDDVGSDGVGPLDDGYTGADADGTEGNHRPDQGEPNFGRTDPDESDQIGLTSFNFFNQTASPNMSDDELLWDRMRPGRFDIVPSQPQDGDFIYGSGYFPMRAKQTERFSVALLFGETYDDIIRNLGVVQQIYNAGYKFPQPPRKPKITITEKKGKVVIYWDGKATENSRDFMTKSKDFEGYKIYRSTDAGFQDSRTITDALGVLAFDKPIAQFDLKDGVQGFFTPSSELLTQVGGTTYYLGNDSGITNKFVDSNVVAGQRYYYAVVAYDSGFTSRGYTQHNIFPTENSKFIFQTSTGQIITDDNTGYITPGQPPAGYVDAQPSLLKRSDGFLGTGGAGVEIVDDQKIRDGNNYAIVFQDSALQHYTTNWSLVDLSSPDSVVINATGETKFVRPGESVSVPHNQQITVNGYSYLSPSNLYTANYDTLISHDTTYSGNTPIIHGFKVQLRNDKEIILDTLKSGFASDPSALFDTSTFNVWQWSDIPLYTKYNGIPYGSDYQIEFSNTIVDTSLADTLKNQFGTTKIASVPVTFKVKNLSTNEYIDFDFIKIGGVLTNTYKIIFREHINNIFYRTWALVMYYNGLVDIEQSGTLSLYTLKPFRSTDVFTFTTIGAHIDQPKASKEMDLIKVVPNPYIVTHMIEPRLQSNKTGRGDRIIRFTHVPPGSSISIFTVRGELVIKLHQDDMYVGDVSWNLRTSENLDAAFGMYIYVVESPGIGTKTGKFALIK